ncbi:MAG: DUF167 domain-containing protein [Elusimicrobiota bacterium]
MLLVHTKVQPSSSRQAITRMDNGEIKINLTAPPSGGKANRQLIEYLAQLLDISKKSIRIKKGKKNSRKVVQINGVKKSEFNSILE